MENINFLKNILFTFTCILLSLSVNAQNIDELAAKARDAQKKANEYYDLGRVDIALSTLEPVLDNRAMMSAVSRDVRADMYRVAALSCFLLQKRKDGMRYVEKVMENQPYYREQNANKDEDLHIFKAGIDTLYAIPDLKLGVSFGLNVSGINKILQTYSMFEYGEQSKEAEYKIKMGVQANLHVDRLLFKRLSIQTSPSISSLSFEKHYSLANPNDPTAAPLISLEYKLKTVNVLLPIGLSWRFSQKANDLFLGVGYYLRVPTSTVLDYTQSTNKYSITGLVAPVYGYYISAGRSMHRRLFEWFWQITWSQDMQSLYGGTYSVDNSRYFDPKINTLVFGSYQVPNDVKLYSLSASGGIKLFLSYKVYQK